MKSFITSICKCLLTLLGFSAVGCNSPFIAREEYGSPYADFEVKGKVVDAELSQPVQGLKVSAMEQNGNPQPVVTGTTDAEGRFSLSGSFFPSESVLVKVEDTDQEENGGLFQTATVSVSLEHVSDGEGWYSGMFSAGDVEVTVTRDISSDW